MKDKQVLANMNYRSPAASTQHLKHNTLSELTIKLKLCKLYQKLTKLNA